MQKKLLVAVDASIHSKSALKYAARMAGEISGAEFVLFHIQPMVSGYLAEEAAKSVKARAELGALNRKNREDAQRLLEECRLLLTEAGVAGEAIKQKTIARSAGVADDLINEAETGSYDAVLIGRRGLSSFQELFMGSVSSNLLAHSRQIPVWLVDGMPAAADVLVAVDGSVNSLRALDHLAFILEGNPRITVDLLHVEPRLGDFCEMGEGGVAAENLQQAIHTASQRCLGDFQEQAFRRLEEAGFKASQIHFREEKKRLSPARAILDALGKQAYGTLVLGRQGMSSSRFMGKVAGAVIQRMKDRAVWVVP